MPYRDLTKASGRPLGQAFVNRLQENHNFKSAFRLVSFCLGGAHWACTAGSEGHTRSLANYLGLVSESVSTVFPPARECELVKPREYSRAGAFEDARPLWAHPLTDCPIHRRRSD